MIWLCIGTDCLNMAISFIFLSQNMEVLGHLFPKKSFVGFALLFSLGKVAKFCKKKLRNMGKEIILGKYLVNMPNHEKFLKC
jgi:hypothetical protein